MNDLFLEKVLENTSVHWFKYDIKNEVVFVPKRTWYALEIKSLYKQTSCLLSEFVENVIYSDDIELFYKTCGNLKNNINDKKFENIKIKSKKGNLHLDMTITVVKYDEYGQPSEAICIIEIEKIKKYDNEKFLLESSVNLMRGTYYRIASIDINKNSMSTITIAFDERNDIDYFYRDYDSAIRSFTNSYVVEKFRAKFINVMSLKNLKSFFDTGAPYMDITYQRFESGKPRWVRTELIPLPDYSEKSRRIMWYVKNISEEKALEEKLSDTYIKINTDMNLRIQAILNGISGGFKISRDDNVYSYYYVGETVAKLFGYTVDEFLRVTNGNAKDNIYLPDLDKTFEYIKKELENNNSYSVKYRVKCKDGSLKWVVDSGTRIINENGEKLLYCFYNDVTELENQNAKLKNYSTMIDQMLVSLSSGVFAYRLPSYEILVLNDEAKRLFDCADCDNLSAIDFNEMIYKNIFQEDIPMLLKAVRNLNNAGDSVEYVFRIRHKNGNVFKINVKSRLLQFDDGELFILSSIQDITEQSMLTTMLVEERKQYRDALTSNCLYSFSVDMTEGILYPYNVSRSIIGDFKFVDIYSPVKYDDFIDKWMKERNPQFLNDSMIFKIKRNQLLEKFENGEKTSEIEYYQSVIDKYIRVTALMSKRDSDSHIMIFFLGIDTTKDRVQEQQIKNALIDAYESAKRANAAKSNFLSRMSHDIRTPMNAIIGMTAIAGANIDDKERVLDCLGKITVSSRHLLSLINEVLDMSKIESGKVDLNETEFNLADLIDNLVSMIFPQTQAKNQKFNIYINNFIHEKVIGDDLRIRQLFVNLISNSIKYTDEGGNIDLYVTEKPSGNPKLGCYEFIFNDNGIGMDTEFVNHIFEPFTRANDIRVSNIQGTGLGMAIANNLVHMMNGDIKVESQLGKGTKVTVTISLKLQDADELSIDNFLNLKVLVANNEQSSCESICQLLNEMGMCSEWVLSGEEVIEKVREHHNIGKDYFAVILDWEIPFMNGIEITKQIRSFVNSDVTNIIISSYDWSEIEVEAKTAGADSFISKPLFKSRLIHLFRKIISGNSKKSQSKNEVEEIKQEDFSGIRILLAEDNDLNAEITIEILSMMNIEVDRVENGREVVDKFNDSPENYYDLIFMDIRMPIMNGNEASSAIRSLSRKDACTVPIVAMTANAFSDDVQAAFHAGMNGHISKPLDLNQLLKTLKKWLKK